MILSKFLKLSIAIICTGTLFACGSNEPYNEGNSSVEQDAKLSVIIDANGKTSNGAVYSKIDGTTFYLDYVKYRIVESHLEIIEYDNVELPETPKLYANVTIDHTLYKTRSIIKSAFEGAKISSIVLPETVTDMGWNTFTRCSSLTKISLPKDLKTIRESVFEGCASLSEIILPNSLSSIEKSAFEGCTSLTQMTLPNSLTTIGPSAFKDCTALSLINLPESVTKIYDWAFSYCRSLAQIILPKNCEYIGDRSFFRCDALKSVTFLQLIPPELRYDKGVYIDGEKYTYPFTSNPKLYVRPISINRYLSYYGEDNIFSDILPIDGFEEDPEDLKIRTVLLMNFTGQNNVNGQTANNIIESLQKKYGEETLVTVNIHAGSLAIHTNRTDFDKNLIGLMIDEGNTINDAFGINSWPMGVVNKIDAMGAGMNCSQYDTAIRNELATSTDVNIKTDAVIEGDKVIATTICSAVNSACSVALHIWLVEDNIVAPQAITIGRNMYYVHNNVLRYVSYPVNTGYTVNLKKGIEEIITTSIKLKWTDKERWNPDNLSIVAFVSEGKVVQNAVRVKVAKI